MRAGRDGGSDEGVNFVRLRAVRRGDGARDEDHAADAHGGIGRRRCGGRGDLPQDGGRGRCEHGLENIRAGRGVSAEADGEEQREEAGRAGAEQAESIRRAGTAAALVAGDAMGGPETAKDGWAGAQK